MARTQKVMVILPGCLWLLLMLTIPGITWGAEFSALMMVKDGPKIFPGKIYVSNGKMRQEFVDEQGHTVTIVRPDKKVFWVILPLQRSYMEMPLKARLPGQFIQIPPQALNKRQIGQERVAGYEAEKFQVSVPGDRRCEIQTYWVAPKLGLPVKMECRERQFSLEYRNIKEEKIPERLFDPPPGYRKATGPQEFSN
ncbi:MAG: DUF4412 domain-containing protein [Thermodesulfobacteriota bacterium]